MICKKVIKRFYKMLLIPIALLIMVNAAYAAPGITSPSPGATLSGSTVTFNWTADGTSVDEWWLYIGTTAGGLDIYDSGSLGLNTTTTVSGLPTDGSTVHVRLWYRQGASWPSVDFQYTAYSSGGEGTPEITSPIPGSTLSGTSVTFNWTAGGTSVDEWWLYIGTTAGGLDIYDSGSLGLNTSTTVSGLPTDGSTVHVRIWYRQGASWPSVDFQYTAYSSGVCGDGVLDLGEGCDDGNNIDGDGCQANCQLPGGGSPEITSPTSGSTLSGSTVTFNWTAGGTLVDEWWLYIGTTAGGLDIYDSGSLGLNTTTTVSGLPTDGSTVHVRLWYRQGTSWPSEDFQYTAYSSGDGNIPPVASIDSISPDPAQPGELITFSGSGTDDDGTVEAYQWDSSIDGPLSTLYTFSTALSDGIHIITFKVQDEDGAWSPEVSQLVNVTSQNIPPVASIDSISPDPAQPGEIITFSGSGTDDDGTVEAYQWDSSIDGPLSTLYTFSTALSDGTHIITFKVQDEDGAWSPEVSQILAVEDQASGTAEHIYIMLLQFSSGDKPELIYTLQEIGAQQVDDNTWEYTNPVSEKNYVIHNAQDFETMIECLYGQNHCIFKGHSNYGLGGVFIPDYTNKGQVLDNIRYIDDDLIFNYSAPMVSIKVYRRARPGKWPYWWPIDSYGNSGIMPYDFGDSRGDPPYNYYIMYQIPGDPTYYKVETVRNSAPERFPDSGVEPWDFNNGPAPDSTNPDHLKYFITNPTLDYDWGSTKCGPTGNLECPQPHFGKKTIVFPRELDFDIDKLKYKRLLLDMCNTCSYYLTTFQRGITFCTATDSSTTGSYLYLKAYLEGKSDQEIWEIIQDHEQVYEYFDFNKRPFEQ